MAACTPMQCRGFYKHIVARPASLPCVPWVPKPPDADMRVRFLRYSLPLLLFANAWASFMYTGWHTWRPALFSFLLIPLAELVLRPSPQNLSQAEEQLASADKRYDYLLLAVLPLQYLSLVLWLQSLQQPLAGWELAGRITAMGILCGVFGINVAHELGHRHDALSQWAAKMLLTTSLYTHFFIEHNKGHHRHVATPTDPSSAPLGYSLYRFWGRTLVGTLHSAWQIAAADARKAGHAALSWHNEFLRWQCAQLGLMLGIGLLYGWFALLCFVGAACIGALLLETVNYIEHYGLSRAPGRDGHYERVMPHHSWNSDHTLGRLMLFELSRHSDHHYMASRKYQVLRHHHDAPQLPTGYPGSMLLATIPPLWFWVMNKKVAALQKTM